MTEDKIIDRTIYGVDAVVFSIQQDAVRVLMLRRNVPEENFQTGWEFVKGALKAGETFADAASREIEEETGLAPTLIAELEGEMTIDARYRKKPNYDFVRKRALVFLDAGGEVAIDAEEHDDWAWMDFEKACERVWVDRGREILERSLEALKEYLKSKG